MLISKAVDVPCFQAKYPNVLLNGCLGIGYGLASNIPPFNFKEVVTACIQLMNNPNTFGVFTFMVMFLVYFINKDSFSSCSS